MTAKKGFEYINHTADTEFIAYGKDIEEVFENCFLALFDTIADTKMLAKKKDKTLELKIKDKADTLDNLLWFVMQDALSITDEKGVFGYDVKKVEISQTKSKFSINATLLCKKEDQESSRIYAKGISRFDLKVEKTEKGYKASVVVDI